MFKRKTLTVSLILSLFVSSAGFAQDLEDNWNDFLHYIKIGRFDLAKGYGKVVIDSNPAAVKLLELSEQNPTGFAFLQKVNETAPDAELAQMTGTILNIIEKGRFLRRSDSAIIAQEVRRLNSTERGRLLAAKRLRNSGEYAIPFMVDAISDSARKEELANIVWALPKIGKDAIRPLAAALKTDDVATKAEIIKALGQIGYPQSLAYLKYVLENENSQPLFSLVKQSINQIDPAAINISAAELFYKLGENYYYHTPSLTPSDESDFANIWFWDTNGRKLFREEVAIEYFNELMAMRCCEWSLKADPNFSNAIGLWIAASFKAESTGIGMPEYFGQGHPFAIVYATTAGPEYVHQALARALKDGNAYVAFGAVKALAANAGEKSLFYRVGAKQPLLDALTFDDKAVRYTAAIAIAAAGPKESFDESRLVVDNLVQALAETTEQSTQDRGLWNPNMADVYANQAAQVMFNLAQTQNPAIDLSKALEPLINASKDQRRRIRILAAQILARLDAPQAQGAIAQMALSENNPMDIRIAAFDSLALSAKINANLLSDDTVDVIYSLIASSEANSDLRSAAAAAFGALNLPSRKVKNLILDQAKS